MLLIGGDRVQQPRHARGIIADRAPRDVEKQRQRVRAATAFLLRVLLRSIAPCY